jgi:type I restriction enzyme R subunit
LEIVFFMWDVKSANYFEQMKGRGSRIISQDEFRAFTPDGAKTRFVIVEAIGVCEGERVDNPSLDRQPSVSFDKVLQVVAIGSTAPDVLTTLASRLARLDRQLTPAHRQSIETTAGQPLTTLISGLINATDPDVQLERAQEQFETETPSPAQVALVAEDLSEAAVAPFLDNTFRELILSIKQDTEQVIDKVTTDELLYAGQSEEAKEKARTLTASFAAYLKEHRDEITALQFLYARPVGTPPTFKQLKELAAELSCPPNQWTPEALWQAYESLENSRVRGSGKRMLTDLISLIRFALEQETILAPFAESVNDRFTRWLSSQESAGRAFTPEQRQWLEMIRDHIAASLTVDPDDFEYVPFSESGGFGAAYQLFGEQLNPLLQELNTALTA